MAMVDRPRLFNLQRPLERMKRLAGSMWARRAWALVLGLVALITCRTLLRSGSPPLGAFDEALLLVDGELLHRGQAIFRDFSANYPPGIYVLMRGIIASGLPPIWTMRVFGFVVRLATAVLAARLAGRARGEGWSWTTGVAVLAFQCGLGLVPYAYSVATVQVMLIFLAWLDAPLHRWARVAAGVMFGLLSYVRLDVCIYLGCFWGAMEVMFYATKRRPFAFARFDGYVDTLVSAGVTSAVLWAPVIYDAGLSRVLHDLIFDVSRLAMPARVLPFPDLFQSFELGPLRSVPMLALKKGSLTYLAWLVCLTISAAFLVVLVWRGKWADAEQRGVWLLVVGTLVTIPAATGRSDYPHIVYGAPFFFAAAAALTPRALGVWLAPLLVAICAGFSLRTGTEFPRSASWFLVPRADDEFRRDELAFVARMVQNEIPPDEPIFVGCDSHARHIISPLDVYYFSHRPGATRYMQFDPGLTTSEPVHEEMIADLEYSMPRLFIQHRNCTWFEPNLSQQIGSQLLDAYLQDKYVPAYGLPTFVIWRRRETLDIGFAAVSP